MPTVLDVLAHKGAQVFVTTPESSVREAAHLMNTHGVGALVVQSDARIVGIFTERDVLRRVVAESRDPGLTKVEHVMTREVATLGPDAELDDVRATFMNRRIRHLPVVDDDGRLLGMVSIGDVNAWTLDGQALEIHYLHEYITGSVA